ncbi:hypothetical protein HII36_37565 [Nonomuraea sp. NN258]|uniref:hypothetical protein n=1 Tax=Nonomuraea antri TaxID=2730852 RepID=UPI001568C5FA|nr:hypothetical protein [Nonomuraea antri]NRQ37500.1 hypothetical protein [Nonomuraea antri]
MPDKLMRAYGAVVTAVIARTDHEAGPETDGIGRKSLTLALAFTGTTSALLVLAPALNGPRDGLSESPMFFLPGVVALWIGFLGLSPTQVVDRPGIVAGLLRLSALLLMLLSPVELLSWSGRLGGALHALLLAAGFQLLVTLLYWCHLAAPAVVTWVRAGVAAGLAAGVPILIALSDEGVVEPLLAHRGWPLLLVVATLVLTLVAVRRGVCRIPEGQAWTDEPRLPFRLLIGVGSLAVLWSLADVVFDLGEMVFRLNPVNVLGTGLVLTAMIGLALPRRGVPADPRWREYGGRVAFAGGMVATFGLQPGSSALLLWDRTPQHVQAMRGEMTREMPSPGPAWAWIVLPLLAGLIAVVIVARLRRWAVLVAALLTGLWPVVSRLLDVSEGTGAGRAVNVAALVLLLFALHPDVAWVCIGLAIAASIFVSGEWSALLLGMAEWAPAFIPQVWLLGVAMSLTAALLAIPRRTG